MAREPGAFKMFDRSPIQDSNVRFWSVLYPGEIVKLPVGKVALWPLMCQSYFPIHEQEANHPGYEGRPQVAFAAWFDDRFPKCMSDAECPNVRAKRRFDWQIPDPR